MKHLRFYRNHSIVENVFLKTLFSYIASTLAYSIGPLVDGIRVVMNMARDVQYYNISDTNNLIIKI